MLLEPMVGLYVSLRGILSLPGWFYKLMACPIPAELKQDYSTR